MEHIEKAIKLKSDLDALRPLKKEDELRIMQKFRLDWNFHSNHLEGNSLTFGETKALIYFGITAQGKPLKDHFEITGHDEAINWVLDVVKQERPLTENFIRELHKLILKEPYEVDAITPEGEKTKKLVQVGQYKTTLNHVKTKTGEIFRFATPEETPALMNDLLSWYNDQINNNSLNPVLVAAEFHYKFIRIHPFDDGNGRTARILMNFILLQNGYPPVIIKTQDKANYFSVLQQADAGVLEPFLNYIGANLVTSLEIMIRGAKGESIEEPDDIDKEISLLEQKLNSVSVPVETYKDLKSLLNIYDNSIVTLAQKFAEKAKKYEKFYAKGEFKIFIDKGNKREEYKELFTKELRQEIDLDLYQITLRYDYSDFNRKGFEEFNYRSNLYFDFGMKKSYSVSDSNGTSIFEKLYSEQLTEKEMTALINSELKRHKDFIEEQIEKVEKPK